MLAKHREILLCIKGELIGLNYAFDGPISSFVLKLARELGEVLDEDASYDVFVEGDTPKVFKKLEREE